MQIGYQAFWLPKAGNAVAEYEDAYWPQAAAEESVEQFRCAVADGASESTFSGPWARLLVSGYSCGAFINGETLQNCLPSMQGEWRAAIDDTELEWFASEKLRTGAFATLTGLTLHSAKDGAAGLWEAVAIGDSCVFQTRDDELIAKFPIEVSDQFGSSPDLLRSVGIDQDLSVRILKAEGEWRHGDVFYLMTDALSQWFLNEGEQNGFGYAVQYLGYFTDQHYFEAMVAKLRDVVGLADRRVLKNDDVTFLRISVN